MPKKLRPDPIPFICYAGKKKPPCEEVKDLLKIYPSADYAEALVKEREKWKNWKRPSPNPPAIDESNQVKELLSPSINKSRFQEFRDQFYEKLYCKKVPLGKSTPTNSKPDHITNEDTTFGKVLPRDESLYNLVLPNRNQDDVLREFIKWHDKYLISHGKYFPSEQINRKYTPPFNRNKMYGKSSNCDVSSEKVKYLIGDVEDMIKPNMVRKAFKDFVDCNTSHIGVTKKRFDLNLDPDMVFPSPPRKGEFDAKDILYNTLSHDEVTKYANETTYRVFMNDVYRGEECRPAAGSLESRYPRKQGVKFYSENLGEETTAGDLISPSIPMNFGLSHRDFFLPRPKEQIREIFSNAGYELKDDEFFENVYAQALKEWTSMGDKASVEAFKYAYNKIKNKSN